MKRRPNIGALVWHPRLGSCVVVGAAVLPTAVLVVPTHRIYRWTAHAVRVSALVATGPPGGKRNRTASRDGPPTRARAHDDAGNATLAR